MKFAKSIVFFMIVFYIKTSFAQLGINGTGAAPAGNAMLDISSTTKGLLIPRMTTAQRNALVTSLGLTVYDTDTQGYWFHNGLSWQNLLTSANGGQWTSAGLNIYSTNIGSGNVGIGITTPAAKLDVKATGSYVAQFNGLAPMYMGIFENDVYRGYWGSYSGAAEDVDFGTGSGTTGKLHLTIQANPKLTINNLGKVGIGTTNPSHLLHVNGGDLFVQSSSGLIRFGYQGSNEWQMATTGGGADLRWYTSTDGGTTITPRHYFSQNGNVGIGGFSGPGVPNARLDVQGIGNTSTTNAFMLRNSLGDTLMRVRDDNRIGINYNGSSYGRTLNLGGTGINFYTNNEAAFGGAIFPTDTSLVLWSNSGPKNYLVLQPSWGNTGVGIYNPKAKLHVNGTAIIGQNGTLIKNIIKLTVNKDIVNILANSSNLEIFSIPGAALTSTVSISPSSSLAGGLLIAYARVSSVGNVEVNFTNVTGVAINPAAMDFYISVIE